MALKIYTDEVKKLKLQYRKFYVLIHIILEVIGETRAGCLFESPLPYPC